MHGSLSQEERACCCPLAPIYDARFDTLERQIDSLHTDVKSLLATRSFTRGVWRTVVVIAGAVSAAFTLALQYIRPQ